MWSRDQKVSGNSDILEDTRSSGRSEAEAPGPETGIGTENGDGNGNDNNCDFEQQQDSRKNDFVQDDDAYEYDEEIPKHDENAHPGLSLPLTSAITPFCEACSGIRSPLFLLTSPADGPCRDYFI